MASFYRLHQPQVKRPISLLFVVNTLLFNSIVAVIMSSLWPLLLIRCHMYRYVALYSWTNINDRDSLSSSYPLFFQRVDLSFNNIQDFYSISSLSRCKYLQVMDILPLLHSFSLSFTDAPPLFLFQNLWLHDNPIASHLSYRG